MCVYRRMYVIYRLARNGDLGHSLFNAWLASSKLLPLYLLQSFVLGFKTITIPRQFALPHPSLA